MTNRLKMAEITTIAKLLGSAHAVVLGDLPILKRFQVHPNGKSRFKELNGKRQFMGVKHEGITD